MNTIKRAAIYILIVTSLSMLQACVVYRDHHHRDDDRDDDRHHRHDRHDRDHDHDHDSDFNRRGY